MTKIKNPDEKLLSLIIRNEADDQNSTLVPLIALICFSAFLILFFFAGYSLKLNFKKQ